MLGCDLRQAADRTAVRRRVGLLAHATGLYEDLTVADNVRFWARACGATQDRGRRRTRRARPRRSPGRRRGRQALGRPAAADLDRRARRPPQRAVAARRAPRRTRPGRPRRDRPPHPFRRRGAAPLSSWRPTSSTGPAPSPTAPSPSPAGPSSPQPTRPVGRPPPPPPPTSARSGVTAAEYRGEIDARTTRRATNGTTGERAGRCSVFRDAALVAGKDLRIEWRSRVTTNQVAPFAHPRADPLRLRARPRHRRPAAGDRRALFWVAILFSALLAVQRSFALEAADGNRDALRLSGLNPGGHLPRQGRRRRARARRSRGRCSASAWSSSTARPCRAGCCWSRPAWSRPSGWRPPVASTACSRPVCGCERRCSRSCCSRSSHRCCSVPLGPSRLRSARA